MKILFIHNNFPAQFGGLGLWLAKDGWDVSFATQRADASSRALRIVQFKDHARPRDNTHRYLRNTEKAVITGQGFARAALTLRKDGYVPDVVVAHSGWGSGQFAKDVWPETRYVQYVEWYYNSPAVDRTPHDRPVSRIDERAMQRIRNAPFWTDFSGADAVLCPTGFQADQFPDKIRPFITVLHDGIDTALHCPAARDAMFLASHGIPPGAPLVTYIARGMEPTRGFPEFMAAVSRLQGLRADVHVVVIGEDRVAYGPTPSGLSWKRKMLQELPFDSTRLHFVGNLPRPDMIRFLQASNAHVYLSVPFVLSWSLLEAMSCAAPIVASDTAPVREFITHGHHGSLVIARDPDRVVSEITAFLDTPEKAHRLGKHARSHIVGKFDAAALIYPCKRQFFRDLAASNPAQRVPQPSS